jgi:hypothetical protein
MQGYGFVAFTQMHESATGIFVSYACVAGRLALTHLTRLNLLTTGRARAFLMPDAGGRSEVAGAEAGQAAV